MEELKDLVALADLPMTGFLIVAVYMLWKRLNQFIDAWVSYLQKRADEGERAAQRAMSSSTTIPIVKHNGDAK